MQAARFHLYKVQKQATLNDTLFRGIYTYGKTIKKKNLDSGYSGSKEGCSWRGKRLRSRGDGLLSGKADCTVRKYYIHLDGLHNRNV